MWRSRTDAPPPSGTTDRRRPLLWRPVRWHTASRPPPWAAPGRRSASIPPVPRGCSTRTRRLGSPVPAGVFSAVLSEIPALPEAVRRPGQPSASCRKGPRAGGQPSASVPSSRRRAPAVPAAFSLWRSVVPDRPRQALVCQKTWSSPFMFRAYCFTGFRIFFSGSPHHPLMIQISTML